MIYNLYCITAAPPFFEINKYQLLGCFHLLFYSYDYNMHVEGLLSDSLCLVTLLSSE